MKWNINYFSEKLQEEILILPNGLLAKYIRFTEMMENYGPNLGMPHTKSLKNGLFELRLKGKEGIARVFYCTTMGKNIYMLHSFIKKTNKTPSKELLLARQRMKEVKYD